jgi:hypothetical protein
VSCVNLLKLDCCWDIGSWEGGDEALAGGEEANGILDETYKPLLLFRVGFDVGFGGGSEFDKGEESIVVDGMGLREAGVEDVVDR